MAAKSCGSGAARQKPKDDSDDGFQMVCDECRRE